MIRYFALVLTLMLVGSVCVAQNAVNEPFPFNVQRDWKILPDITFRGSLRPTDQPLASRRDYWGSIRLLGEEGNIEKKLGLDEIHPEDVAWIKFASIWAELSKHPEMLPDPEKVEVWTKPIERQRFPRIGFKALNAEVSTLPYFFACYAAWWDATGFLPAEKSGGAQWAFDLAVEYSGGSSERLDRIDHTMFTLLQKAYGQNTGVSVATVPWVDASILHHYSNSNDMLLLQVVFSRSGVVDDGSVNDRIFFAIAAAYESGTVDFLYDGKLARAELRAVNETTTLPGLAPGAMELVIADRKDVGRFLQSPTVRVFINPTQMNPLWVFRPFRTKGADGDTKKEYLIPPPPIEGFDESVIVGLPEVVAAPPVLKKREPFEFKETHLPRPIGFQQKRIFEPREWTSSGGKKMVAAYMGKLGGFPEVRSLINRDGREMEISHDQLSPFDRTYLTMMNADSGVGPTEGDGRILYRLSKAGEEIPSWLEVKFSDEEVTATMQRGSAFFITDTTIPESHEALVEKGSDIFQINWTSMQFRNLTRSPTTEPAGLIDVLGITSVRKKTDNESKLESIVSRGTPAEHLGLPVREVVFPEIFEGGLFDVTYSNLRFPWLTGFWKVFSEKSDSPIAKELEPASKIFQTFHRLGFVPTELRYENSTSPELSFHLEVEEIQLTSESSPEDGDE